MLCYTLITMLYFNFITVVDEPLACDSSPCANGGVCYNDTSDGYYCACPAEWTGANCEAGSYY